VPVKALTRALKVVVGQIRHVLSLQQDRGEAPRVLPHTGHAPEPARQPGQVTITNQFVVGQTDSAQSVHVVEHVLGERRQAVVVQCPGTTRNMCLVRLIKCFVRL
jgi:hypothetical protein